MSSVCVCGTPRLAESPAVYVDVDSPATKRIQGRVNQNTYTNKRTHTNVHMMYTTALCRFLNPLHTIHRPELPDHHAVVRRSSTEREVCALDMCKCVFVFLCPRRFCVLTCVRHIAFVVVVVVLVSESCTLTLTHIYAHTLIMKYGHVAACIGHELPDDTESIGHTPGRHRQQNKRCVCAPPAPSPHHHQKASDVDAATTNECVYGCVCVCAMVWDEMGVRVCWWCVRL